MSVAGRIYWLDDNILCSAGTKLEDRHIVTSAPRFTLGGFLPTVACNSDHYWMTMALAAIWEYELNDVMKGVLKGC